MSICDLVNIRLCVVPLHVSVCCRMWILINSKKEVRQDKKMALWLVCVKYSLDMKFDSAWGMANCDTNKFLPYTIIFIVVHTVNTYL